MTIVLATRNQDKISEIRTLLTGSGWEVRPCEAFPGCPIPEETGSTFEENALLKAHAVARHTGEFSLADDSGLKVDALGGAPGIYSARFSGAQATDAANNAELLKKLDGVPDEQRTARFCCVIAVVSPDGRQWTVEGSCEGHIGTALHGTAGFGYDPLFTPEGHSRTFAELGHKVKNRISHRAGAIRATRDLLRILEHSLSDSSSSTNENGTDPVTKEET